LASRLIIVSIFIGCCYYSYGQHRLSGKIISEQKPTQNIPLATIEAFCNEAFVTYTTADIEGNYLLEFEKPGEYLLRIRSIGYAKLETSVNLTPNQHEITRNFRMDEDIQIMESIQIEADAAGMQMSSDTIKYNVESYANGTEQSLGDVLSKLPGVTIDKGTVRVNGEKIDHLLINGKNIFDNQQSLATRNLTADMVEEVQLLNNYATSSQLTDFSSNKKKAVNINLKESYKNKIVGNLSTAAGPYNRYHTRASAFHFGTNAQLAVIASANNTGEKEFSLIDYLKFTGELFSTTSQSIEINDGLSFLAIPDQPVRSRDSRFLATNYLWDATPKLQIHAHGITNKIDQTLLTSSISKFLNIGNTSFRSAQTESADIGFSAASVKLEYRPSEKSTVRYKVGYFPSSTGEEEQINFFSNNSQKFTESRLQRYQSINQSFTIRHLISDRHLLDFSYGRISSKKDNGLAVTSNQAFLGLFSDIPPNDEYSFDQSIFTSQAIDNMELSWKFKQSNQLFQIYAGHETSNNNYYIKLDGSWQSPSTQQGEVNIASNHTRTGIKLIKNRNLLQYNIDLSFNRFHSLLHTGENFSRVAFLSRIRTELVFNPLNKLTLIYNLNNKLPPVESYYAGVKVDDFQRIIQGSVGLSDFNVFHQAHLRYFLFDQLSNTLLFIGTNFSQSQDIFNTNTESQDTYVRRFRVWSGEQSNLGFNITINKKLTNLPWLIEKRTFFNYGISDRFIESNKTTLLNRLLKSQLVIYSNRKAGFNSSLKLQVSHTKNQVELSDVQNFVTEYSPKLGLQYIFKKGIVADFSFVYRYFQSQNFTSRSIFDLGGELSYLSSNNRWRLALVGNNLLYLKGLEILESQQSNSFLTERSSTDLPGYVLLKIDFNY
jgi:hypothetical protein